MSWDSNTVNEWSTATLNTYLNGEYYIGFNNTSKLMIGGTKYYLGGRATDSTTHYGTASDMYAWERGTKVYKGRSTSWDGKIALVYPSDYAYTYAFGVDNTCYADGYNCRINNGGTPTHGWIYNTSSNSVQWLLSPRSDVSFSLFRLDSSGYVGSYSSVASYGVRPTLYLKPNVKIKSGDGSIDNPYEFEL